MAYAAHIGGFVAGLALVKVFTIGRDRRADVRIEFRASQLGVELRQLSNYPNTLNSQLQRSSSVKIAVHFEEQTMAIGEEKLRRLINRVSTCVRRRARR